MEILRLGWITANLVPAWTMMGVVEMTAWVLAGDVLDALVKLEAVAVVEGCGWALPDLEVQIESDQRSDAGRY